MFNTRVGTFTITSFLPQSSVGKRGKAGPGESHELFKATENSSLRLPAGALSMIPQLPSLKCPSERISPSEATGPRWTLELRGGKTWPQVSRGPRRGGSGTELPPLPRVSGLSAGGPPSRLLPLARGPACSAPAPARPLSELFSLTL